MLLLTKLELVWYKARVVTQPVRLKPITLVIPYRSKTTFNNNYVLFYFITVIIFLSTSFSHDLLLMFVCLFYWRLEVSLDRLDSSKYLCQL